MCPPIAAGPYFGGEIFEEAQEAAARRGRLKVMLSKCLEGEGGARGHCPASELTKGCRLSWQNASDKGACIDMRRNCEQLVSSARCVAGHAGGSPVLQSGITALSCQLSRHWCTLCNRHLPTTRILDAHQPCRRRAISRDPPSACQTAACALILLIVFLPLPCIAILPLPVIAGRTLSFSSEYFYR